MENLKPKRGIEKSAKATRDLEKAHAHFEKIQREFLRLPEVRGEMRFSMGAKVTFPIDNNSHEMATWEIVRAEKKHYLLERQVEHQKFDHAFCSEEELTAQGN